MIAFVGLGNPGSQYADTKHNAGFWVVDELARRWNLSFTPGKGDYVFAKTRNGRVSLVKPTSGMNISGNAVVDIRDQWNLVEKDIHVIVDDVDLPLGRIRVRPGGGDGCHRGMESIIYRLGDNKFPRIRYGIGTNENMRPAERYVLKPFLKEDRPLAEEMITVAADAAEMILYQGLNKTMNRYNQTKSGEENE